MFYYVNVSEIDVHFLLCVDTAQLENQIENGSVMVNLKYAGRPGKQIVISPQNCILSYLRLLQYIYRVNMCNHMPGNYTIESLADPSWQHSNTNYLSQDLIPGTLVDITELMTFSSILNIRICSEMAISVQSEHFQPYLH